MDAAVGIEAGAACGESSCPLKLFVMLTKEVATALPLKPAFIEPMLASPVRELPDGAAWSYEAKLDGYRCLAAKGSRGDTKPSPPGHGFAPYSI